MERQAILDSHRKLILEIRTIEKEIEGMLATNDPAWRELEKKRNALYHQVEPLIEAYWKWIPTITLSQCPYCQEKLIRHFDKHDFNGFWWMDRTQRPIKEPKTCEHFCLLSGAVDLQGHKMEKTLFECHPGPSKPFVIPRILNMEGMSVVISEIPMSCGYTTYPIAYFSTHPPKPGTLTQSWAKKEYWFQLPDGKKGWNITQEEKDFDLKQWARLKKVFMYQNNSMLPFSF